jgi:hypothetical protein
MFRPIDVEHMSKHNILLDDYTYMSDLSSNYGNAQDVEDSLVQQTMPPGGPYWTAGAVESLQAVEKRWVSAIVGQKAGARSKNPAELGSYAMP